MIRDDQLDESTGRWNLISKNNFYFYKLCLTQFRVHYFSFISISVLSYTITLLALYFHLINNFTSNFNYRWRISHRNGRIKSMFKNTLCCLGALSLRSFNVDRRPPTFSSLAACSAVGRKPPPSSPFIGTTTANICMRKADSVFPTLTAETARDSD